MTGSSVPRTAMRVGKYEVIRRIATGTATELYLARLVGLDDFRKLVVLKWMRDDVADLERAQQSFVREARIAARLDHPNIVHTVDLGLAQGRHFVAMEYVHGETAATLLARAGTLSLDCALRIATELLAALEHAHERADDDGSPLGIVHRDVTATNVIVTYDGRVVLVDFGIARASAWDDVTYTGEIRDKLDRLAPEQVRGDPVDHRADLWAVGMLLRRLLGVAPPPEELAAILERATAENRERRFASAAQMSKALLAFARAGALDLSPAPLQQLVRHWFGTRLHPGASPASSFASLQAVVGSGTPSSSRVATKRPSSPPRSRTAMLAVVTLGVGTLVGTSMWLARAPAEAPTPPPTSAAAVVTDPRPATTPTAIAPPAPVVVAPPPRAAASPPPPRARERASAPRRRRVGNDPDALLPTREVPHGRSR